MSEMMCCPLSNDSDSAGEVFDESTIKAGKNHTCYECHETITIGTLHERTKGIWDGSFSTFRTCLSCVEIRDHGPKKVMEARHG